MSVIRKLVAFGGASALMLVHGFAAPPLRPLSGKGAGATTLVIYTDTRTAFSLGDLLALLQMQLQRVATRVETSAVSEATPAKLAAADYLVVFCPQSSPLLATNFLQAILAPPGHEFPAGHRRGNPAGLVGRFWRGPIGELPTIPGGI